MRNKANKVICKLSSFSQHSSLKLKACTDLPAKSARIHRASVRGQTALAGDWKDVGSFRAHHWATECQGSRAILK